MTVPFRFLAAAALTTLLGALSPALAGGACRDCYREVVEPPVYETKVQPVLLRGPRTGAIIVPAQYTTVTERVEIEPARRIWQVSRDAHGRKVGCWVTLPGRSEWRQRRVVSRPAELVPVAMPTVYGLRQTPVLVAPARLGWEPVQHERALRAESVISRAY